MLLRSFVSLLHKLTPTALAESWDNVGFQVGDPNQEIIKALRPGFTMTQMDSIAKSVIGKAGFEKYILHSCTHYLGLDVHDVGDRQEKFAAGCVVTVEPGIYIPPNSDLPPAYWNIGVRIEDDVLITADGNRNLSAG